MEPVLANAIPTIGSVIVPFLFKLVGAIALWIVGGWLIQLSMRILRRSLVHSSLDTKICGQASHKLPHLLHSSTVPKS